MVDAGGREADWAKAEVQLRYHAKRKRDAMLTWRGRGPGGADGVLAAGARRRPCGSIDGRHPAAWRARGGAVRLCVQRGATRDGWH
eukprot:288736-Rhodomonas_salina.2